MWSAGKRENVQDFAYDEAEELALKKFIRSLTLSDELFSMAYMDLKTGDTDEKIFDDGEYFIIEITNDAFSYDPSNNMLSVIPGKDKPIEEGKMIITWGGAPLAFTSAPISRTIDLRWDNLNNGYTIVFNSNGGSVVPMVLKPYNSIIDKIEDPSKKGYIFGGWYGDEKLTKKYTIPEKMTNEDILVYAKWIPRDDTEYTVEHHLQNSNNNLYTIVEKDNQILKGTTDSIVKPKTNIYPGFNTPELKELTILPDASSRMKYYYSRESYTLTFDSGQAGGEPTMYKYKYGSNIVAPKTNMPGYDFKSWDKDLPETMPGENMTFIAQWTPAKDTPYRVEHYIQNTNGQGYALSQIEKKSGNTDEDLILENFAMNQEGISFEKATIDGKNAENTQIKGNGSLVVKLYYTRNEYKANFIVENGNNTEKTYRYGEIISQPNSPIKDGYTFSGWKNNDDLKVEFDFTKSMPGKDISIYGKLIANEDTKFVLEHYYQNTTGDDYSLKETEEKKGITDNNVNLSSFAINEEGITFEKIMVDGKVTDSTKIKGDGSLVAKLYYTRNQYNIIYQIKNEKTTEETYRFEENIKLPIISKRDGYTFSGWKSNENLTGEFDLGTMPSEGITVYGEFKANKDTEYRVEHYQENLSGGGYTLIARDDLTGITDSETIALSKNYTGFTAKDFEQGNISGDGKTVIAIEYLRNIYNVDLDAAGGRINSGHISEYTYGGGATLPNDIIRQGYKFDGWFEGDSQIAYISTADIGDKNYLAKWSPKNDTPYIVKHIREDLDGKYNIEEVETKYGITDTQTNITSRDYTGFTAKGFSQKTILGDGSTLIEISYSRNTYNLTWNLIQGSLKGDYTKGNVKFGQSIIQPNTSKLGYTFSGWHSDSSLNERYTIPISMPAENITVHGSQTANSGIIYKVIHYLQNANDNEYSAYEREEFTGYTDEDVVAEEKTYDYFNFNENAQGNILSGNIKADGTLELKTHYDRKRFTVAYDVYGEEYNQIDIYKFEEIVIYPKIPEKDGYHFDTWLLDGESFTGTMPGGDIILTPRWSAGEKSYVIRHFKEKLDYTNESNKWDLVSEHNISGSGTFDDKIKVAPDIDYEGFSTPEEKEVTLNSNLSTVDFYYPRNSYKLTWVLNGGIATNDYTKSGQVKFKTLIRRPILETIGNSYTWNIAIAETMPAEDLEYTATWSANSYTVSFNEGDYDSISVSYGDIYGQLAEGLIKTGHTFEGWYTDTSYNKKIESTSKVDIPKDHTLYAKWTVNRYNLVWDLDGGTATNQYTKDAVEYGTNIINPIPSKKGHDFTGWDSQVVDNMPAEILTYKATWQPADYTITLNPNGGTVISQSTIVSYGGNYGGNYGELDIPTKTGHIFDGWFTGLSDGEKVNGDTKVTIISDQVLYAHWTAENYNLTWDLAGGQAENQYTRGLVPYGTNIINPIPSKIGHEFTDWDLEVISTMPAEDLEYTAIWTPMTYSVTLNPNGGTINQGNIGEYTYGLGANLPTDISRHGYTFTGWSNGSEIVTEISGDTIGDKTYIAQWSRNSYKINYHNMDGVVNHESNPDNYNYETEVVLGSPTKDGYSFVGWYEDEALDKLITEIAINSTGDKDIYPKWQAKVYTVTLNKDGGNLSLDKDITSYTYDMVTILPTKDEISKTGYTFAGWSDGQEIVLDIPMGSIGEKSYTATWSILTYNISYQLNGGGNSLDNPSSYNITNEDINLADPSKSKYTFDGWFMDESFTSPVESPAIKSGSTENVKFYAKWKPFTYKVVFNANEGTGNMGEQEFSYGEEKTLSANTFNRAGYNFVGWSTSPRGVKVYDNQSVVSNLMETNGGTINLYSLWQPIVYTISYDLNGGTIANNLNPATYTVETKGITLKNPSRDKHTFMGWYDNHSFNGSRVTQIEAGAIGNINLYANWKAKDDIVGIGQSAQTFTFDGSAKKFAITGTDIKDFIVEYKKSGENTWENQAIHAGKYAVKITRGTDDDYNTYELIIANALEIKRASRSMTAPTGGSPTYSRILINPVTSFNGYGHGDVEYAVGTSTAAPSSGWSTSLSTGNLSPGSYHLFARVSEGGDYLGATSGASSTKVTVPGPIKVDRNWNVTIRTSDIADAGTDAKIEVLFNYKGTGYETNWHRMGNEHKDHERNKTGTDPALEKNDPWMISGFKMKSDNTGTASGWHCADVILGIGGVTSKTVVLNKWFTKKDGLEYSTTDIGDFRRRITSRGQFDSWSESPKLTASDTGNITKTFNGNITDQYGTYDAYAHSDAPVMSVETSPGYTDCFSYNGKSFTIDKGKLYNKMGKNNTAEIIFTIKLKFDPLYTNTNEFTQTIKITR